MLILLVFFAFLSSSALYSLERAPYSAGEAKAGEGASPSGTHITSNLASTPQEGVNKPISSTSAPREQAEEPPSFRERLSAHPLAGLWGIKGEQVEYVMEHSKYLICIINSEGKFQRLNQRWKEILGWDIEELLNTPYLNLVHPKDVKGLLNYDSTSFKAGLTNRFGCKDGSYRWLEWIDLPALETPQKGANFISFARDITVEKELERLNKKHLKQLKGD